MTDNKDVRAEVVIRRTYSRPKDDGTFESWEEIVNRVISHQSWLWHRAGEYTVNTEELESFRKLMLERKVTTSGRTLWLGGTNIAKTRESSQFNCSFTKVETVYDVVDVLWLLLQGCGVGFSPVVGTLNGFLKPIPNIEVIRSTKTVNEDGTFEKGVENNSESFKEGVWTITVGDSAEAWAKSIGKLMAGKYAAHTLVLDYSNIRPAGIRLKGYGWISSGDEAIAKAYTAIAQILNRRAGQLLTRMDILDVINWLGTVLSSRRSAQIALFEYNEPEWKEFAVAKKEWWLTGNEQRIQSNNSLLFYNKPSVEELQEVFTLMEEAGGSEPGFVNAQTALKRAPWFNGSNPCCEILLGNKNFCVVGDTSLITKDGIVGIKDSVGIPIDIWNGKEWSTVTPRVTGYNEKMVRVSFGDGSYLDCTPYHRFSVKDRFTKEYKEVEAKDLMNTSSYVIHTEPFKMEIVGGINDPLAYTKGVSYGDGHDNKIMLYTQAKIQLPVVGKRANTKFRQNQDIPQQQVTVSFNKKDISIDEIFTWDKASILAFIAGLADADGSETKTGGIRIYQGDEQFIRKLQLLLTKVGYRSSVNLMAKIGEKSNYKRNKAMWYVQITDCRGIPCHRLDTSKGKPAKHKGKYQTIRSVEPIDGLYTSYCFDEPKRHMGVFNNTLTYQCNLMEVDIAKFRGDSNGLLDAIRLAARANYRQTCVNLKDGILQEAWHLNNEFLRLCGVGLTGIARRDDLSEYDYEQMKLTAVTGAFSMADELGMQRPKNVTTVKPSGTLSKVMSTTEGVHKPLGKYIFNSINFGKHDPLLPVLKEANYTVYPNPADPEGVLAVFPVAWEEVEFTKVQTERGEVEINIESAITQLERYKKIQVHYCQQNVSNTISYSLDEVPDIITWLLDNWDIYVGVSFLYRADPSKTAEDLGYLYLPQAVVTKEEYTSYVAKLKTVDLTAETKQKVESIDTQECAGGACPVI